MFVVYVMVLLDNYFDYLFLLKEIEEFFMWVWNVEVFFFCGIYMYLKNY